MPAGSWSLAEELFTREDAGFIRDSLQNRTEVNDGDAHGARVSALWNAGDKVTVRTAGSAPAAEVRSAIVTALNEIGVTLGGEFPKPLTDEAVRAADVVVTMGCGDACPVYPGRRYLDWDLADPVDQPMSVVREIRDDIDSRVRSLLAEVTGATLPDK